jgi:cation diffusion facilitator CzcD-associated flavoprotein CzcO
VRERDVDEAKAGGIAGMETFRGHSFHTSRWDYDITGAQLEKLSDKVGGIIGTGATAVQAVPALGAAAKELYVFQRTPSSIDVRDDWETDPAWAASLEPGWQAKRREKMFTAPPLSAMRIDKRASLTPEEKVQAQERANIDYMMRIHRRIEEIVEDRETAEALKPWYMFMCKRPCFHNDYLPTFNRPNVHLVDTHGRGITEIAPDGPVFDGRTYPLDLLIYATGFEVQKTGTWNRIVGEHGVDLDDKYREGIRTLLGVHTHGFPNLFVMGGYQASFNFNLTDVLQAQGDHIAACVDHVRRDGHRTMDATPASEDWWVEEVIAHRGRTSRNAECTPGYYNFEGELNRRQDGNYNGGFPKYYAHLRDVRAEMPRHFRFTD